jgi:RimJ/RimL family protein N-acetyltransferase
LLETERLVLRPVRPEDVDAFVDFAGDEQVMQWIGDAAGGRELAAELVERWVARWETNDVGPFVVELGGEVIGRTGLLVWDDRTWRTTSYADAGEHAESELGWAISSRFWGRGYATEAARAVREWAYAERGLERLISLIDPANVRSVRVAVKLGARPEQMVDIGYGPAIVWVHPR